MNIVTSHANTDFDALASMVAACHVYPGSVGVVPAHVQPAVREFLAVHWDLLRLRSRKSFDPAEVARIVVTDTSSWERLDDMRELARREDLSPIVWDHHMGPGSISAVETHREETGACVTLLLEHIQAQDLAFSPVHATLFLLGIYDDTGCLGFPCTTARDAHMAAFLLENGADLNVVSAYLDDSLDERHIDLFTRMLDSTQSFELGGLHIGICMQDADKSLNMLPTVVTKFKEIKGLDAAFGIFPMSARKTVVIARGNPRRVDVGNVVRQLGGGGHPGAGSAVIQEPIEQAHARVMQLLHALRSDEVLVQALMTPAQPTLSPRTLLRDAAALLDQTKRNVMLVLDDEGRLLGSFDQARLTKVTTQRQWDKSVTSMLRRDVISVAPRQTLREALQLMAHSEMGFLPVVEDNRLVGEITRAAIILNMYDF